MGTCDNIWRFSTRDQRTRHVWLKDKRARILNDGGTIGPCAASSWRFGREFTKTRRGVVRAKYQQPLRNIPNTFVVMRGSNKGTVFERIGKRIVPIAWLRKFVFIRGRKFMEKTERFATAAVYRIFQARMTMLVTRLNDTLSRFGGR